MNQLVIGNYNYSSWSMRGWLAVRAANINAQIERVPLFTPNYHERLRALTPAALVPALIIDNRVIADSLAICEYAAELKPSLWPADQLDRAYARSLCAQMHSGFTTVRSLMPMNCRASNRKIDATVELESELNRLEQIWSECRDQHCANGPWLFGTFSNADIMFAPVVSRFQTYGVTPDACRDYASHVLSDPLLQQWYALAEAETEIIDAAEIGKQATP